MYTALVIASTVAFIAFTVWVSGPLPPKRDRWITDIDRENARFHAAFSHTPRRFLLGGEYEQVAHAPRVHADRRATTSASNPDRRSSLLPDAGRGAARHGAIR